MLRRRPLQTVFGTIMIARLTTVRFATTCMVILAIGMTVVSPTGAHAYTRNSVIDGFVKTVFGSEFGGLSLSRPYIRKFNGTVRFYIRTEDKAPGRLQVERFILSLNGLIRNLRAKIVTSPDDANFVVHVVRRRDYGRVVRQQVLKNQRRAVRGRCMVRSIFTRNGISRSDAVIVVDEGRALFRRCMTEEILQGLGPLNDDRSLTESMFNDSSRFTSFRRFDRIILNMLYDRRVRNGMSRTEVRPMLPTLFRDAINHISRGG